MRERLGRLRCEVPDFAAVNPGYGLVQDPSD